jgi:hypothetical protein
VAWPGKAGRGNAGKAKGARRVAGTLLKGDRKVATVKKSTSTATPAPQIILERIEQRSVNIPIVGVSPVIPHQWSEKARRLMLEAQSGAKAATKRDPKLPEMEAEASLYRLPDGTPGMPAVAFKAAIVGAVRLFRGITMVEAKAALFVEGIGPSMLVPIEGELTLREDMPRNANGNADLRYRYAIYPWSTTLTVQYLPSMLSETSVVALVDAAGNGGIGDWRPSSPKSHTGIYGRFQVADA